MTVKDKDHKTNDRGVDSGSGSEPATQHHSNLPQRAKSDERNHMGTSSITAHLDVKEQTRLYRESVSNALARLKLEELRYKNIGAPQYLKDEIKATENKLENALVDPLVIKLNESLHKMGFSVVLPTRKDDEDQITGGEDSLTAFAAVWGLLELDHAKFTDDKFANQVAVKLGEYTADQPLFKKVLEIMAGEVQSVEPSKTLGIHLRGVDASKWAAVVRILRDDGVPPNDPFLTIKTRVAIARAVGFGDDTRPSTVKIDLPDLEKYTDVDIQQDNLNAVKAIYFAAMMEEMKFFQVVDKIIELFQRGMLPFGKSTAGDQIYNYWRKAANRFTEIERRNLYARIFGLPGGDSTQSSPNREFNDLWLRFISSVANFVRQTTVDDMLRSGLRPFAISQEGARKAGRDLASNLSLHGYGVAHFAAADMQSQLNEIKDLLCDKEMQSAYGARDLWQVIDQISTLELGGPRNTSRYRTMARSGAVIIAWLANHASDLASTSHKMLLTLPDPSQILPTDYSSEPMNTPTDLDLVDACQQWLAVTGTPDQSVEQYAQPAESPNITSKPIPIPDIAREMLESVGVGVNKNGKKTIAA
jgi:hypothetical protein